MTGANENRYSGMQYKRVGRSGLKLPVVSLGLWYNFGDNSRQETMREMVLGAFDLGVTHFDIANNYGPPAGSSETNLARILHNNLKGHRDELVISTKAGFGMWEGPYGEWGSRKHLLASLDQSLKRLGLEYVDIYYHHRPDPDTPIEESMGAMAHAVRSGKVLYIGISNYDARESERAITALKAEGVHMLIHQPRYNIMDRRPEQGLYEVLDRNGVSAVPFSPLNQGILTDRYLKGIPKDSRAASRAHFLKPEHITDDLVNKVQQLDAMARARGQSLAQMAIAWLHRSPVTASVIIGASKLSQIQDAAGAQRNLRFSEEELRQIDEIVGV